MKNYEEMNDSEYLKDLAERIRYIPAFNGVDGYDVDRIEEIANKDILKGQK